MGHFRGRYRTESTRWAGHDYGAAGWTFVTVCTRTRAPWFGDVTAGRVRLSAAGRVVVEEWLRTPVVRPLVALDGWVVMPDHVHGILGLRAAAEGGPAVAPEAHAGRRPAWRPGVVGAVVNQFKGACTRRIRSLEGYEAFAWQARFYDVVIRSERHLDAVRRYVAENPARWVDPWR